MNDYPEIKMSPLCQEISSGEDTIKVEIYDDGEDGWILEVVDEHGNSTVWDAPFPTDAAALAEVKKTLMKEDIQALIGSA